MQVFQVEQGLLDYYKENNPEYSEVQITNVERLSEGWETVVFKFTLSYTKDEHIARKALILRFYPGKDGFEKAEMEFNLLASLMMTTITTPDPYRLEKGEVIFGLPFIIMEFIAGEILARHYINYDQRQRELLVNQFTRIFVDLHALDWETYITNSEHISVSSPYAALVSRLNEFKVKIEEFDKKEFIPVLRWLVERMDTIPLEKLSLLHGDYHLANVIVDEQEEMTVIDWVKASVGDYRIDLAWTLITHETILGKQVRDQILTAYQSYAGYAIEGIKYFEVMAILRQLIDLSINLSYGNEASRLNPSQVDKMRENLDPIKRSLHILYGHTRIKLPEFEKMLI